MDWIDLLVAPVFPFTVLGHRATATSSRLPLLLALLCHLAAHHLMLAKIFSRPPRSALAEAAGAVLGNAVLWYGLAFAAWRLTTVSGSMPVYEDDGMMFMASQNRPVQIVDAVIMLLHPPTFLAVHLRSRLLPLVIAVSWYVGAAIGHLEWQRRGSLHWSGAVGLAACWLEAGLVLFMAIMQSREAYCR